MIDDPAARRAGPLGHFRDDLADRAGQIFGQIGQPLFQRNARPHQGRNLVVQCNQVIESQGGHVRESR